MVTVASMGKLAPLLVELIGLAVAKVAEGETDQPNRSDVGMEWQDERAESTLQIHRT